MTVSPKLGRGALVVALLASAGAIATLVAIRMAPTSAAGPSLPEAATPPRTSAVVTVASGQHTDGPWALRVHTVRGEAWEGEGVEDGICLDWRFPGRQGPPGPTCVMGHDTTGPITLGPVPLFSQGKRDLVSDSSFIGMTPEGTASVVGVLDDGRTVEAEMSGPFPEFGPTKFYVAFTPPREAVTFQAIDQDGAVLWEERKEPSPS